jgi:uncharacterized protein
MPGAGKRREAWPWLLAAGPAAVVVASLATAWLAVTRSDAVVDENYYKLGLTINRRLAATPPAVVDPDATVVVARNGDVEVRLQPASPAPAELALSLRRPGEREGTHVLNLRRADDGTWQGALRDVAPGRRIVTLASNAWRLPVTVVDGLPATIRIRATRAGR